MDIPDNLNLVDKFEKEELERLGKECHRLYKEDEESRSEWLEQHEEYLEIYHQLDSYNSNYGDAYTGSDARVPLLTESCLAFQSRAFKAIFPQRSFIATTSLVDITPEEMQRSERIAKWMNYYLNFRQRRYKRDKKRMLLATALMGSDFSKIYPDPTTGLPIIERVRAQDFVVCYGTGPRELGDIRRKTQRITMDMNKARKLHKSGFFSVMPKKNNSLYSNYEQSGIDDEIEGTNKVGETDTCVILEQHTYYDVDGDTIEEPVIIWVDDQSQKVLRIAARFNPEDPERRAREYFEHYTFIDNTDGFYGLGYGHLVAKLNQALNQMVRNSIDAGDLANCGNMGGFVSESVGIKGGEVEFPIGRFIKTPRNVEDLQKAIYQMKFPGPNPAYTSLIEYMQGTIQRLANTTEAVSGDVSKVYQPMTILTMLEQSLQLPTSVMENIALTMEGELDKIFNIAAESAEILQTFTFDDQRVSISADDFRGATRIYPIMDPRSVTKQQKMAKAQGVYQLAIQNPLIANDPNALYNITYDVLEAMEVDNIDAKLPKPQNQQPQQIDDQYMENMYYMLPPQERPLFDVFPEQDHQQHIAIIDQLIQGEMSNREATDKPQIADETLQALMLHKQKHVAYLYGQMHGVFNGQGQLGVMEAQAGDQALSSMDGTEFQMGGIPTDMPIREGGEISGTSGGPEGNTGLSGEGVLERYPLDQQYLDKRY